MKFWHFVYPIKEAWESLEFGRIKEKLIGGFLYCITVMEIYAISIFLSNRRPTTGKKLSKDET